MCNRSSSILQHLQNDLQMTEALPYFSDSSVHQVACSALLNSVLKKLEPESTTLQEKRATELFLKKNDECGAFLLEAKSLMQDQVLNDMKVSFENLAYIGPVFKFGPREIFAGASVGPGASINVKQPTFYNKLFNSTLACTNVMLYRDFRYAIRSDPRWHEAEVLRHAHFGNEIVVGSRLFHVPKDSEIARTCCTEPPLNMFAQKGIGAIMTTELKKVFNIDLSTQPDRNRRMAMLGSIDGDLCTVDLKSASDSISLELCKREMPPELLRCLMRARSPAVLVDRQTVALNMISSMGNGFTFPLQTFIFASLVTACYRALGITVQDGRKRDANGMRVPANFGVFGDDIIVRREAYSFVTSCLSMCGFTVNDSKSFSNGYFRESCGGDYFKGHDVRGVYLKHLKTESELYTAANVLNRWSQKHAIPLANTISYILGEIKHVLLVPMDVSDNEGYKVDRSAYLEQFQSYWYRIRKRPGLSKKCIRAIKLVSSEMKQSGENGCLPYLSLKHIPKSFSFPELQEDECYQYPISMAAMPKGKLVWEHAPYDFSGSPERYKAICSLEASALEKAGATEDEKDNALELYNPNGVMISFLGGYIRNGKVGLRTKIYRAKVTPGYTPCWDKTVVPSQDERTLD